jgi:hypothetical protein
MSEVSDAMLKRIRALLAMSRDTGSENEAAIAAAKVQELLLQYNLSIDDVEKRDSTGKVIEEDLMTSSSNPWRRDLALAVARLYFCDYWWQHVRFPAPHRKRPYVRGDRHNFVGLPHNVVVAKEMFVYLVDTVERLAKEARRNVVKNKIEIDGKPNEYEHAFRHGCAMRIKNRIWAKYHDQTTPPAGLLVKSNVPALYTKMSAEVTDYMQKTHGALRVMKNKGKHSSLAGVEDGDKAGKHVSLDVQIGTEQVRMIR